MSGTPPAEEEAPVYRGKTLTPESPRPLHVPSPANIPVLENQIDPIFNLMATHTEPSQPQLQAQPTAGETTIQEAGTQQSTEAAVDPVAPANQEYNVSQEAGQSDQNSGDASSAVPFVVDLTPDQMTVDMLASGASIAKQQNASKADTPAATESQDPDPDTRMTHTQNDQAMPLSEVAASSEGAKPAHNGPDAAQNGATATQTLQGVASDDVQALIKSLQVPATAAAAAAAAATPSENQSAPNVGEAPPPSASSSLPPRPPPQEKPAIHPNYEAGADIRSFHFPNTSTSAPSSNAQSAIAPVSVPGSGDLPPLQMPNTQQGAAPGTIQTPTTNQHIAAHLTSPNTGMGEARAIADSEAAWRTFLDEESVFTKEGAWEKFPHGSRLFVGNLPTESVSRREIYDIFHKYGKLAQIAIKQAYGFVQFMDVESCQRAMKGEQNARIKERNMHLEISKPPKAGRGGNKDNQSSAAGDRIRDRHRRDRSRSPGKRNRGSRGGGGGGASGGGGGGGGGAGGGGGGGGGGGSTDMRFTDFRDEPRRSRDDYRPGRSPSPRRNGGDGYRPRDRSADRHYDGRRRSRSPYGRSGRRSPSPRRSGLDDDDLPLPRRAPRDVPDVQIILVEEVSRQFVEYVVAGFQSKGIRCDVLTMPRVSLEAVIRRQIIEGALAVCALRRQDERIGKVSLRVFDRSQGQSNVRFDEYEDLTMPIAAELVLRAKSQSVPPTPTTPFGGVAAALVPAPMTMPYGAAAAVSSYMAQQPGGGGAPANIQSLISSLDPASLQQLLGVVQQQQQQQHPQHAHHMTPQSHSQQASPTQTGFPAHDSMAAIMAGMTPQQQQQQQQYQAMQQQQQRQQQDRRFPPQQQQQHYAQVQGQQGANAMQSPTAAAYHYGQHSAAPQQQPQQGNPYAAYPGYPTPAPANGAVAMAPQQQQQQQHHQQQQYGQSPTAATNNVQSIMEQLANIQRKA